MSLLGLTLSTPSVEENLAVTARISRHQALRLGGRSDAGSPAVVTGVSCTEAVVLVTETFAANTLVCLELVKPNGDGARRMTLVGRVLECHRLRRGARMPACNGAGGIRPHAQVRVAVLSADSALGDWLAEMTGQQCSPMIPPITDDVFVEPLGAL